MLKHIKHFIEQSWLLMTSAVFFGLLLAVTNAAWRPRIIQNEIDKFNNLAGAMITDANSFEIVLEDVEIISAKGKPVKTKIQKAISADGQCLGWAFVCEGAGFQDKIKVVLTVDAAFEKLAGFGVLFSNETPGFGDKIKNDYFKNQFAGAPAVELTLSKSGDDKIIDSEIIAITGATVSSEAVVTILNNYIAQVKKQMKEKGLIENAN
jgi:electron transport complex protein RnfG